MKEYLAAHPLLRFMLWGLLPYALGLPLGIAERLISLVHTAPLQGSPWSPFTGLFLLALFQLVLYSFIANDKLFEQVKFVHVLLSAFAVSFGGYLLQDILLTPGQRNLSVLPWYLLYALLFATLPAVGAVVVKYLLYRHKIGLLKSRQTAHPFRRFVLWSLLPYVLNAAYIVGWKLFRRAGVNPFLDDELSPLWTTLAVFLEFGLFTWILYLTIANDRLFEHVKFIYVLLCTAVMSFIGHYLFIFSDSEPFRPGNLSYCVYFASVFSTVPAVIAVVVKYLIYRHKKKKRGLAEGEPDNIESSLSVNSNLDK